MSSIKHDQRKGLTDETVHRSFFENNPLPMWIHDASSLKFIRVNEAAVRKYGYSREEFLEMTVEDISQAGELKRIMKTRSAINDLGEWNHRLKSGEVIAVEATSHGLDYAGQKAVFTVIHDVTQLKQRKNHITEVERIYRDLIEAIPIGYYRTAPDGSFIQANPAFARILGYNREELLLPDVYEKLFLDTGDRGAREMGRGFPSEPQVYCLRKKDGTEIRLEGFARSVRDRKGEIIYNEGICREITETKREHEAIERYEVLAKSTPDVILLVRRTDGRILDANKAAENAYGYARSQLLEKTIFDLNAAQVPEAVWNQMDKANLDGVPFETLHSRSDGARFSVEVRSHDLIMGSERVSVCIVRDLLERKQAEEAFHQSQARLKAAFENLPFDFWVCDASGRYVIQNPACVERWGNVIGLRPEDVNVPEETLSVWKANNSRAMSGQVVVGEVEYHHNGERLNFFNILTPIREGDRIEGYSGINVDITDRKAAEKELLESEERYRLLVEQSPVAIVVHSNWKLVYINGATLKLSAADSADQLLGKSILEFIHPDYQGAALDHVVVTLAGEKRMQPAELKFLRVDGSTALVEVTSAPIVYLGKPAIQSVIHDISERKRIEDRLRLQSAALNTAANAIVITDREGKIEWVNPSFERLTGYHASEAIGTDISYIVKSGKQDKMFYKEMWDTILSGRVWHGQLINRRRDGALYSEEMTITPVSNDEGTITHFVAIKEDITQRKSLEEELAQAQKLDAIGKLAGGVAHDYNNILGVVLGYGELIKNKLHDDEPIRHHLDGIIAAARRGSDLTKQLLSFARGEAVSPKVVNLNSAIESIKKMLQRIIGENLELVFRPEMGIWNVKIDPTQLDQILVNLATNARDAVDDIGTITIETSNVLANEAFVRDHADAATGEYVKIVFSDTGKGMDEKVVSEIFEPFFTTKPKGRGTGLGLAMVYEIVRQNKGIIEVHSEPGAGTTFNIYFPRSYGQAEKIEEQPSSVGIRLGTATVLIVEDQSDLLELAKRGLEQYGYKVLTALSPAEALLLCKGYPEGIHLLLADIVMPTMNGREFSRKIRNMKPGIRTLFMSGYTENVLANPGVPGNGTAFIQKPFTPQSLARKVQEVLENGR